MQQNERLQGICAGLAPQLRPKIPRHEDAPCDETERYADFEQGKRRHHKYVGLLDVSY